VVLFDEIEKAHHDVFNILLQILDDGRLTDNQGRTVDFKNTIIIMTSNIGSQYLIDEITESGVIPTSAREQVMKELKIRFRPEFLNRIDEIVIFKPLTLEEIKKIVDLQLVQLRSRLADRHMELELKDSAREYIAREGYDAVYGARPLKRFIQKNIETAISKKILSGEIRDHQKIIIDFSDNQLIIKTEAFGKGVGNNKTNNN
jgi:ATP-dependent Clp protease ATP-binding subunit ClpB